MGRAVTGYPAAEGLLPKILRERLGAGAAVSLRVSGHSMTPCIRAGDVVTLEPLSAGGPRLGHVIALTTRDERLLLHRLVGRRRPKHFVTRGDIAPHADAPVSREAILGVVTGVARETRPVRLGLGWERVPIAWLSRAGLLRLAARVREGLRVF